MIERVNPMHPDKLADRIAGALVDYCYTIDKRPKCAFEVLIGHGDVYIIAETSVIIPTETVKSIVTRIAGEQSVTYNEYAQDGILSENQSEDVKCGDNGIFKGVPMNKEVRELTKISRTIYNHFGTDGKYILDKNHLIVCQSNATEDQIKSLISGYSLTINPLGYWTGGTNVDTGATNRKLGSDMGEAVTGGGLHGKDLSKADVSVNIYAHLLAQIENKEVSFYCAIGDRMIKGSMYDIEYDTVINIAQKYIKSLGGFEKLAEWGLV